MVKEKLELGKLLDAASLRLGLFDGGLDLGNLPGLALDSLGLVESPLLFQPLRPRFVDR